MSERPKPRKQYSISVDINESVSVEVSDVLEQLEDHTLIEEMTKRGIEKERKAAKATLDEALADVLDMMKRGQFTDATLELERLIYPKFRSLELCEVEFAKRKGATSRVSSPVSGGAE